MLRLENNTPSIYCQKSRDFQLFCRLYDIVNNGVKFDIDSIININDPNLISDRLIELLCAKVGFFPKHVYNTNLLRGIIQAFPYMIKNKGSLKGIEIAIQTIIKFEATDTQYSILVGTKTEGNVDIYLTAAIENTLALDDILSYVLPIGYTYSVGQYTPYEHTTQFTSTAKTGNIVTVYTSSISQTIGNDRKLTESSINNSSNFNFNKEVEERIFGTLGSPIVGSDTNELTGNYSNGRNTIDAIYSGNVVYLKEKE